MCFSIPGNVHVHRFATNRPSNVSLATLLTFGLKATVGNSGFGAALALGLVYCQDGGYSCPAKFFLRWLDRLFAVANGAFKARAVRIGSASGLIVLHG